MSERADSSSYYLLLGVTITLVLFGIIMISSSSSAMAYSTTNDSFYYLKLHLTSLAIGVAALVALASLDYRRLRGLTYVFAAVSLGLLVAVEIPGVGHTAGGAARWIALGPISVQPSEIAKLAVLLAGADILAKKRDRIGDFNELAFPLLPLVGVFCLLVVFQPDLGTAFTLSLATLVLSYVAGARGRHLVAIGGGLALAVTIFIVSEPYRLSRFLAFLNPWRDPQGTGFHIIQSLLAFGSGNWHGIGLGLSRQKFFYLPAAHTDFIFAIIGEELGLIGTLLVVALFAALGYAGMKIAFRTADFYGRLLAAGLTATILSQAVINMAAVTGILPITGIPLPLVSFGRSSLIVTLASIGIILNISRNRTVLRGVSSGKPTKKSDSGGRRDGGPRLPRARSRGTASGPRSGATASVRGNAAGARSRRGSKAGA